ncbi:MAG: universal stress protein [Thermodesulfobacteriota bacterium]|nr:universal stress protein [Thermodesulfobacteriota bacterium]
MNPLPKALLLPIDETEESLRPIHFLTRLYPKRDHVSLILHYLVPPLSPVYQQKPATEAIASRKKELLREREAKAREILEKAKKVLLKEGFSEDVIHEHVQEKELSVAHHACRLADFKKVDAVIVQKQTGSHLEGFMKGDPHSALLHHCIVSPIWFVDGQPEPSRAVICVQENDASLRAVDHAAFMLAETEVTLELVHFSRSVNHPIRCPLTDTTSAFRSWHAGQARAIQGFFDQVLMVVHDAGFDADRARWSIQPSKGKVASKILDYCKREKAGIAVLGHAGSRGGTWDFLRSSITKTVLTDFKDMAVWVNQ